MARKITLEKIQELVAEASTHYFRDYFAIFIGLLSGQVIHHVILSSVRYGIVSRCIRLV